MRICTRNPKFMNINEVGIGTLRCYSNILTLTQPPVFLTTFRTTWDLRDAVSFSSLIQVEIEMKLIPKINVEFNGAIGGRLCFKIYEDEAILNEQ